MTKQDDVKAVLALKRADEAVRQATSYSDHSVLADLLTLVNHVADDIVGVENSLNQLETFNSAVATALALSPTLDRRLTMAGDEHLLGKTVPDCTLHDGKPCWTCENAQM